MDLGKLCDFCNERKDLVDVSIKIIFKRLIEINWDPISFIVRHNVCVKPCMYRDDLSISVNVTFKSSKSLKSAHSSCHISSMSVLTLDLDKILNLIKMETVSMSLAVVEEILKSFGTSYHNEMELISENRIRLENENPFDAIPIKTTESIEKETAICLDTFSRRTSHSPITFDHKYGKTSLKPPIEYDKSIIKTTIEIRNKNAKWK